MKSSLFSMSLLASKAMTPQLGNYFACKNDKIDFLTYLKPIRYEYITHVLPSSTDATKALNLRVTSLPSTLPQKAS